MFILEWLAHNWLDVLTIVSVFLAAEALRADVDAHREENRWRIIKHHSEISSLPLRVTGLERVDSPNVDLTSAPLTHNEEIFVNLKILHLEGTLSTKRKGLFIASGNVEEDIRSYFSLPIPSAVWEKTKRFRDHEFVEFVESCRQHRVDDFSATT